MNKLVKPILTLIACIFPSVAFAEDINMFAGISVIFLIPVGIIMLHAWLSFTCTPYFYLKFRLISDRPKLHEMTLAATFLLMFVPLIVLLCIEPVLRLEGNFGYVLIILALIYFGYFKFVVHFMGKNIRTTAKELMIFTILVNIFGIIALLFSLNELKYDHDHIIPMFAIFCLIICVIEVIMFRKIHKMIKMLP